MEMTESRVRSMRVRPLAAIAVLAFVVLIPVAVNLTSAPINPRRAAIQAFVDKRCDEQENGMESPTPSPTGCGTRSLPIHINAPEFFFGGREEGNGCEGDSGHTSQVKPTAPWSFG